MPIAITLRTTLAISHFRDAIVTALNSGAGSEALICSGFFQESIGGGGGYQASLEPGFEKALTANNIAVDIVGVYNGIWKSQYEEFFDNLSAKIPMTAWYIPGFKWHAKIFILSKDGVPLLGIIGSSNMTSRAFGVGAANFNYECDMILWDSSIAKLHRDMSALVRQERFASQIIYTEYKPNLNFGITIRQRLEDLLDKIASSGVVLFK
ncbi:NgoFVII family restriction endonuclease [Oxalobacteraceae sp. CFBP 8763]|jgi:phosphatidylserine/phosphatidylglycerophosphate/cardiolipin synthase-like enzyme|nr:NgoFVII family restriction endonuclease [Oxalobacteraceae sp. CFBP 8763]